MQLHHGPFNKPYKFLKATRYTMGGSYHSYLHQKLLSGQKMLKKVHKMQKKITIYGLWRAETIYLRHTYLTNDKNHRKTLCGTLKLC